MSLPATPLSSLLQHPGLWRGNALARPARDGVASGFPELDAALPGGGWPPGSLTELLSRQAGVGELSLLLPALAGLDAEAGWIVLVAPPWRLHVPAWQAAGVSLGRLLVVEAGPRDASWACEQLLASGALAALLAWLPEADDRALRRLQLATEGRPGLAFLFRPEAAAGRASPAPLRLAVAAGEHALALRILKRRGPPLAQPLALAVPRPLAWARLAARARCVAPEPAGQAQPALP
jgi:protein ImuA